jgi:two-component system response regulator YesN
MYNVWIVDDEPLILDGLAGLVDWHSLKLVLAGKAENGRDALEQIDAAKAQVDILITDIAMPELDGLGLLRELKQRNPGLLGVILSGYSEFDYIKQGMQIGIENYLLKPIHFDELAQTLVHAVEKLDRRKIEVLDQDQVELLKDNILYRWVTQRIGQEQWELRADFLELKLPSPAVAAAVLQTQRPEQPRQTICASLERSGQPYLCFQNAEDDIVLLLGTEDTSARSRGQLEELLHSLLAALDRVEGMAAPVLALGSLEPGFGLAPASYRNALAALEYRLLLPGEPLLVFDCVASLTGSLYSPAADTDAYSRLLFAQDMNRLTALIESDLTTFSRTEGMTPARLRHGAVEMVLQMRGLLKDIHPAHPLLVESHRAVEDILASASFEELKDKVLDVAALIAAALSERQEQSPVIRQIVALIDSSYRLDFSLKTLAQDYRIHPVYLGQLFQKETHQSFSDYLHRVRIKKAIELMKTTSMKTQDIAEAVGYWDNAHFYKHFKKYIGVAPAQYRKML